MSNFKTKPAEYKTINDLFRNIKKEQANGAVGFKKASDVLKESKVDGTNCVERCVNNVTDDDSNMGDIECKEDKMKDLHDLFGEDSDVEMKKSERKSREKNSGLHKSSKHLHSRDKRKQSAERKSEKEMKKRKGRHEESNAKRSKTDRDSNKLENESESMKESVQEKADLMNDLKISETLSDNQSTTVIDEVKEEMQLNESEQKNNKLDKKEKQKKTKIGLLVVKLLTPAYAEKRFESRETFKNVARNISHALIDKGNNVLCSWYNSI